MPAFLTHMVFGEDVVALMPQDDKTVSLYHIAAFNWGLIGPDLLFFRKAILGTSPLPKYASYIHKSKVNQTFSAMSDYIKLREDKQDFPVLLSYFAGFICHYRVDSNIHPFVYAYEKYHLGVTFDRTRGGAHHRIEADIDTMVCRLRRGVDPTLTPLNKKFAIDKESATAIALMYQWVLDKVFGIKIDHSQITKCFNEALLVERILLDPTGFLVKTVSRVIDTFTRQVPFSSHVVEKRVNYDVLNLSGLLIAVEGKEAKRPRFSDLYEEAVQLACADISTMLKLMLEGQCYYPTYTREFDTELWA